MLQVRTLLAASTGWAIASLVIALPAAAALLSSSGSNNNHVGVINYAHSYDGDTIVINLDCTHGSARNSEFKAATFCKNGSGSCAAHSSTANNDATLSIPPHQKGDLYYYASDHSGSDQGYCRVSLDAETAGTLATFTLDFTYYDNDEEAFTVSLTDLSAGWFPTVEALQGTACPGTGVGQSGPTAQPIYTNIEPTVANNVICNEDFIVSLVSGGSGSGYSVNHGALLTVNNNPGGLQQAWQESVNDSSTSATQGFEVNSSGPPSERSDRVRMANRIYQGQRWMVIADPNQGTLAGIVTDEYGEDPPEIISCEALATDGNPDPREELTDFVCDYRRWGDNDPATRTMKLPGSVTQAPPGIDGTGGGSPGRAAPEGVLALSRATRDLAKVGSVLEASGGDPKVWYGGSEGGHLALVQSETAESVEIVTHHPDTLSPSFVSCDRESQDLRAARYACSVSAGCKRSPCDERSWSPGIGVEFPHALFKPRPCSPGAGGEVVREKLKLVKLGDKDGPAGLKFSSRIEFDTQLSPRPDETGFRFLVEDADGDTVVDLDIPGNEAGKKRGGDRWKVRKRGRHFEYRSRKPIGGLVPHVTIVQDKKNAQHWKVKVRGKNGIFDGDDLALPLSVSASLSPSTPPGEACFATDESEHGDVSRCRRGKGGRSITCRSSGR